MPNGLVKELQELKPQQAASLPARDIRARKAPVRSALIRFEALRRLLNKELGVEPGNETRKVYQELVK